MTAVMGRPRTSYTPSDTLPVARPAPALRFGLTCPSCGADVDLRATGAPGKFVTQAIVDCSECRCSWRVVVELRENGRKVTGRQR